MEIDGGSSASNDSNNGSYHSINSGVNYYSDNLFFATNGKLDNYFASDKLVKRDNKKVDYYNKKDDYCMNNKVRNDLGKRPLMFQDGYGKKCDDTLDVRKNQMDYYNKKNLDNNIHLHNIESFGKKSVSFSPDQVSLWKNISALFSYLLLRKQVL